MTLTSFRLLRTDLFYLMTFVLVKKKNMKILKDNENNNTVVVNLTGNFCIVKQ